MAKQRSYKITEPRESKVSRTYWFLSAGFWFVILVLLVLVPVLYFTKKDFANEVKRIRQPRPNRFFLGIDVSQTIRPDILADFEDALISRLQNFIGHSEFSCHIYVFGLPGCGKKAISHVLSSHSPKDLESFQQNIGKRIRGISISSRPGGDEDATPLTTPLFYFLEEVLPETAGQRVIIFSDLVNDDRGCREHAFPLKAIEAFGIQEGGQIIFLYPTPYVIGEYETPDLPERLLKKQEEFIRSVQEVSKKGRLRAFFYPVPDHPQKRTAFLKSQMQNAIPATAFEIVWGRVSKMIDTIVAAVRG
jgi:hypothetical protein